MAVRPRLDAALVDRIAREPDAVVGVFVRTLRVPDESDRRALERAGLRPGTVAGDVVTGRLRACDAVAVARLDFVHSVQLAHEVTRPPLPNVQQDP
jgi:hypothetical protein